MNEHRDLNRAMSIERISGDIGALIDESIGTLPDIGNDQVGQLLNDHGVLLFRGLSEGKGDFLTFSDRLTADFSDYRGGGLRFAMLDRKAIDGVPSLLTTTGHTQSFAIPLHGEMYYLKEPPRLLWFYADLAPASAGETTICDAKALFSALKPSTQEFFSQNRIKYVRRLVDGDWQATFMTDSLADARAFCGSQDLTMSFDEATKTVSAEFTTSALRYDRGVPMFINNLLFIYLGEKAFLSGWAKKNLPGLRSAECPMVVRAEDGGVLPDEVMADVRDCSERLTHKIRWRTGDIVLIDNHRMLHGRAETDGGARSILVRIGSPRFELDVVQ